MKNETKKNITWESVWYCKTFRAIKDKIAVEIANMNFEQIKEYLKENSAKLYAK